MRCYPVWQGICLSFFHRDFYRDVGQGWRALSFVHLLMVLALCWVPVLLGIHWRMSHVARTEFEPILEQLPEISIFEGEVFADVPQPYYIRDPATGNVFAIIDTTGREVVLDGTEARALLTRDRLIYRNRDQTRTQDLSEVSRFTLDQQIVRWWIEWITSWGLLLLYPLLVIGSFLARSVQGAVYALVGLAVGRLTGNPLPYPQILNLALVALTPAIVLKTLLTLLGFTPPFAPVLSVLLAIGYLIFGMKAARPQETIVAVAQAETAGTE